MSISQDCTSPKEQENYRNLMPPPMSPNRLTISMEPRIAPIHLHLTMILKKLFDHPAVIPPFNDGLVATSLVKPLQRIYKGVCMLQDKLHVSQTNVNWLREVPFHMFANVLTFVIQVQQKHNDLTESYSRRERSLVHELEYTRSKLYGKNYTSSKSLTVICPCFRNDLRQRPPARLRKYSVSSVHM